MSVSLSVNHTFGRMGDTAPNANHIRVYIHVRTYTSGTVPYRYAVAINHGSVQGDMIYGPINGEFNAQAYNGLAIGNHPEAYQETWIVNLFQQDSSTSAFKYVTSKSIVIKENVAAYQIAFDANDGDVDTNSKRVLYGNEYGDLPTPTKLRNRFLGWYDDLEDGNLITESTIVTDDPPKILYAHWQSIIGGHTSMTINPENHEISMVRGDSAAIIVKCEDEPFTDGDKIELSVRRKSKTERLVHLTVTEFEEDESGAAYILFSPEDTKDLEFGKYYYDIQLTKANGWVTTIVEYTPFILKEEATYDG